MYAIVSHVTWLGEWQQGSLHKGQGGLVHSHARYGFEQGELSVCLSHALCL